jgi:hypothetical protein
MRTKLVQKEVKDRTDRDKFVNLLADLILKGINPLKEEARNIDSDSLTTATAMKVIYKKGN